MSKLKVVSISMGGNAVHVERLRPIIERCGYELVTIHEHANADLQWDLNTWQSELIKCHIAIAACDYINQPCKSNNRVTTYQSFGLPVICSPLPAYIRIIQNGVNGFIANNDVEWEQYLTILKDSYVRKKIGQAGKTMARAYALPVIASYWRNRILEGVKVQTRNETSSTDKTVDIIIPTYKNVPYLRECLKSIKVCTNHPHNVIVVNGGGTDETSTFIEKEFPETACINVDRRVNFSEANNIGIKHSKAPYVCLMNDDIIVSKDWLKPMVDEIKGDVGIANPLSNCDKGWLHNYNIMAGDVPLGPGSQSFENGMIIAKDRWGKMVAGFEGKQASPELVYGIKSPSNKIYTRDWVAMFCTLISKKVVDQVGLLDEEFKTGSEDLDYCIRASKLGYKCCVVESSFVLHFGGVSRKADEDKNFQKHQEEDKYNNNRIQVKYNRPLVVIQTGYGWEQWGPDCKERGLGGSEQWCLYIAEAMAKQGVRVVVFAPTGKPLEIVNSVEWYDSKEWDRFISMNYIDICMVSRYVNFFETPIRAAKKYLFVHDIFALCSQENGKDRVQEQYDRLDGIFVLSEWHRDFFADYHKVPKDKLIVFSHGLDLTRFGL